MLTGKGTVWISFQTSYHNAARMPNISKVGDELRREDCFQMLSMNIKYQQNLT